jgi:hypothetical protein
LGRHGYFALLSPKVTQTPLAAQALLARDALLIFSGGEDDFLGSTESLFVVPEWLSALCVQRTRASIGIAVHGFGKRCKSFLGKKKGDQNF